MMYFFSGPDELTIMFASALLNSIFSYPVVNLSARNTEKLFEICVSKFPTKKSVEKSGVFSPSDHPIDHRCQVTRSSRYPLMVDPQGQALAPWKWLAVGKCYKMSTKKRMVDQNATKCCSKMKAVDC